MPVYLVLLIYCIFLVHWRLHEKEAFSRAFRCLMFRPPPPCSSHVRRTFVAQKYASFHVLNTRPTHSTQLQALVDVEIQPFFLRPCDPFLSPHCRRPVLRPPRQPRSGRGHFPARRRRPCILLLINHGPPKQTDEDAASESTDRGDSCP